MRHMRQHRRHARRLRIIGALMQQIGAGAAAGVHALAGEDRLLMADRLPDEAAPAIPVLWRIAGRIWRTGDLPGRVP